MDSEIIRVHDKSFRIYITEEKIRKRVREIAETIRHDLNGHEVTFLVVLNGAFIFAADLLREISLEKCQISFLKLSSYQGTTSTGTTRELIGINENLENRMVVIVEDIIDTGCTLDNIISAIKALNPSEVRTACLLFKPDAYKKNKPVDYIGFSIPNDFIIGYGLDYDGLGRQLKDIYQIV